MTLATERYRASIEADELWQRHVKPLLAAYWAAGGSYEVFSRSSWRSALGVPVQGGQTDPLELVAWVTSLDMSLHTMRRCEKLRNSAGLNHVYVIAMKDIEEPHRPWHNERGTGACDALGITVVEGLGMLEQAKECVWRQMEEGCEGCHLPPGV